MKELDFCIKKIFSNFTIDRKNVVSAILTEPFERLVDTKVIKGARDAWLSELYRYSPYIKECIESLKEIMKV